MQATFKPRAEVGTIRTDGASFKKNITEWTFLLLFASIFVAFGSYNDELVEWDFLNYHFYIGYAYLNDVQHLNQLVSQSQTFLFPFLDALVFEAINAFGLKAVQTVLACLHATQFLLLYHLIRMAMATTLGEASKFQTFALAFVGCAGPIFLTGLGGSSHDVIVSVGFLLSLILVFPQPADEERLMVKACRASLAGVIMGALLATKLTSGPYGLGVLVFILLTARSLRTAGINVLAYGTLSLMIFFIVAGPWMLSLYQNYDNPLFPFMNSIFGSPLAAERSFDNELRSPQSLKEALFYPFIFTAFPSRIAPDYWVDFRYSIYYFLLLASALAIVLRLLDRWPLRFEWRWDRAMSVSAGFVATSTVIYVSWLFVFPTYRYLSGLEAIIPITCVFLLCALASNKRNARNFTIALFGLPAVALLPGFLQDQLSRTNSDMAAFESLFTSNFDQYEDSLVIMTGFEPTSFVIPFFPDNTRFARIQAKFDRTNPLNTDPYAGWLELSKSLVASHPGPYFVLFAENQTNPIQAPEPKNTEEQLGSLGLVLSRECEILFDGARVKELTICAVY